MCLGSDDSRVNPHMRAKFGCNHVEKRGVQTDKGTLQLYILYMYVGMFG